MKVAQFSAKWEAVFFCLLLVFSASIPGKGDPRSITKESASPRFSDPPNSSLYDEFRKMLPKPEEIRVPVGFQKEIRAVVDYLAADRQLFSDKEARKLRAVRFTGTGFERFPQAMAMENGSGLYWMVIPVMPKISCGIRTQMVDFVTHVAVKEADDEQAHVAELHMTVPHEQHAETVAYEFARQNCSADDLVGTQRDLLLAYNRGPGVFREAVALNTADAGTANAFLGIEMGGKDSFLSGRARFVKLVGEIAADAEGAVKSGKSQQWSEILPKIAAIDLVHPVVAAVSDGNSRMLSTEDEKDVFAYQTRVLDRHLTTLQESAKKMWGGVRQRISERI